MSALNPFATSPAASNLPAAQVLAIVTSDIADQPYVLRAIYVGVGGDIELVDTAGNTTVHKGAPQGSYIGPFAIARVKAGATTATNLLGYV